MTVTIPFTCFFRRLLYTYVDLKIPLNSRQCVLLSHELALTWGRTGGRESLWCPGTWGIWPTGKGILGRDQWVMGKMYVWHSLLKEKSLVFTLKDNKHHSGLSFSVKNPFGPSVTLSGSSRRAPPRPRRLRSYIAIDEQWLGWVFHFLSALQCVCVRCMYFCLRSEQKVSCIYWIWWFFKNLNGKRVWVARCLVSKVQISLVPQQALGDQHRPAVQLSRFPWQKAVYKRHYFGKPWTTFLAFS